MRRYVALLAGLLVLLPVRPTAAAPARIRAGVSLQSIRMLTPSVGWALGGARNPAVFRTTDGGSNWATVFARGRVTLAPAFVDAQTARVAVLRSFGARTIGIFRTGDAGRHWVSSTVTVPAMSAGSLLQLDFPSRMQGWLLAGDAPGMGHLVYTLWRTSDGGARWTKVAFDLEGSRSAGAFPGCNCLSGLDDGISFRQDGTGWVTGEPFATSPPWIYVTHNGGRTWSAQPVPRVGGRTVQVTHTPIFIGPHTGFLPVELSPPGANRLVAAALATSDGGRTWRATTPVIGTAGGPNGVRLLVTSFVPGAQGWIAANGALWHTPDGGRHWQRLNPSGWRGAVGQLQFLGKAVGFAVPVSSHPGERTDFLLRTDDGGRSWRRIATYDSSIPIP